MIRNRTGRSAMTISIALLCAGRASGQPTTYRAFGIEHEDIGLASHAINPDGSLTVSNIGSSGLDGVSLNLGEGEWLRLRITPIDAADPGALVALRFESSTQFGPTAAPAITSLEFTDVGTEYQVCADFSALGASTATVEFRSGGVLVQTETGWDCTTSLLLPSLPDGLSGYARSHADIATPGAYQLHWDAPVTVTFNGTPILINDMMCVPEGVTDEIGFAEQVSITGSQSGGSGQFTILDEGLGLFDVSHRGDGAALMTSINHGNGLTVSNIGSSGQDGVSIDLEDAVEFIGELDPVVAPPGASLQCQATGVVDGDPDRPIVVGNMTYDGTGWLMTPDFSPIGATQYNAEAYLGGASVGISLLITGATRSDEFERNYGFSVEGGAVRYDIGFSLPTTVNLPGVGDVIADAVRFTPAAPTSTVDSIQGVQWTTGGIADITLKRGTFTPASGNHEFGHHFGLLHAELGAAIVQRRPTEGIIHRDIAARNTLLVSNIGSSGLDGVSIEVGQAKGFKCLLDLDPAPSPVSRSVLPIINRAVLKSFFETGTTPTKTEISGLLEASSDIDQVVQILTFTGEALPGGVNVEYDLDGTTVFSTTVPWPPVGSLASGNLGPVLAQVMRADDPDGRDIWWVIDGFPATPVTYPGQTSVLADRIIIKILDGAPTGTGPTYLSGVELLGADGSFSVLDESLIQPGGAHTSRGRVHLIAGKGIVGGDDYLSVSNIGSSGQDGVTTDFGDGIAALGVNSGWSIGHEQSSTAGLPFASSDFDFGSDIEPNASGTLHVERSGPDVLCTPDFGPVGAYEITVEVFHGTVPVAGSNGLADALARLLAADMSNLWGVNLATELEAGLIKRMTLEVRVNRIEAARQADASGGAGPQPIEIQLPGQAAVLGDRIVFTPVLPAIPVGSQVAPSQVKVLVSGVRQVDLINDQVLAVLSECQKADTDGSGNVNVVDLLNLLGQWGPCPAAPDPCPGDNSGDGSVSVVDLLNLLGQWGPCP